MRLFANVALATVFCLGMCGSLMAHEEGDATAAKTCTSETCGSGDLASSGESCGGCAVTNAMASLPKISFMVGGEATCCSASAAALAKSKSAEIEYVVGGETFPTKQEAFVSLVEQTEAAVEEFSTPCKCESSGKTKIAGESCGCPMKAGEIAAKVKSAVEQVSMTYAVGDEECGCPNKAKAMAEAAGTKPAFVVAGKKTDCEMTARLNLARAKFKAAVLATLDSEADDKSGEG